MPKSPVEIELDKLSKPKLVSMLKSLLAEREKMLERIAYADDLNIFADALEGILEAVVIYDAEGKLVNCNNNFRKLYNYTEQEACPGVHFSELGRLDVERGNVAVSDEYGDDEEYLHQKAEYRRKLEGSFVVKLKNQKWIKTTDRPLRNGGFISIQVDVTDIMLLEEKMKFMAQHDDLTDLPNRRLFIEQAEIALAAAKRSGDKLAVLFIDIDGFKAVNDAHGHALGDELLRLIAKRLTDRIRTSDVVARYGGDEFVVLLTQLEDVAFVQEVTESIINKIRTPYSLFNYKIEIGASVGIAYFPEDGQKIAELVKKADSAMYQSKANGDNQWSEFGIEQSSQV